MTSLVGVLCSDGVVIGADSSATFGDGQLQTIEQHTETKIHIVGERIIIAGTGFIGHHQRFCAAVEQLWASKEFEGKNGLEFGKVLSKAGVHDFAQTLPTSSLRNIDYSALIAFPAQDKHFLCEIFGKLGFQPELKKADDLWFSSMGSGQTITDPFLALFRSVFWMEGPPTLQGGIFTTLWALQHACEVNPGGIKAPIKVSVLAREKGKLLAHNLGDDEMQEHGNMVRDATKHMAGFRDILLGKAGAKEVPRPAS